MKPPVKIFDGVYLLQMEVGPRPLQLPLLVGANGALLMDTGCAGHVHRDILPAMQSLGVDPVSVRWIINTHCDSDHQGGNYEMKRACPNALLCCGDADREQIESPAAIYETRYNGHHRKHDHSYDSTTRQNILADCGKDQPVDLTFVGGERLRLAQDWELEIIRLPGHSHGHLGILDHRHNALYGGDAIQGAKYLSFDGKPALCPTYLYIQSYLATIRLIEHLKIDCYVGCHWPVLHGKEIKRFCEESRHFVESAERQILQTLIESPATLNDLCKKLSAKLGSWPEATGWELAYAFNGHLEDLENRGLIEEVVSSRPAVYRRKKEIAS